MNRSRTAHPSDPVSSGSDPKLTAAKIAAGGKLLRVEEAPEGVLVFHVVGVPSDFELRVLNDEVAVSVKAFLMAMDHILGLIAAAKRRRRTT